MDQQQGIVSQQQREREELIGQVEANQRRLSSSLLALASQQDWRPTLEEWSFREIAAHLYTVDLECYRERIIHIAAGENPLFVSYFNTGRDFGPRRLEESIRQWADVRREIVETVRRLTNEQLCLTGKHVAFGIISAVDVLRLMNEHDLEHIRDLDQMIQSKNQ